jgi:hypothetical protein
MKSIAFLAVFASIAISRTMAIMQVEPRGFVEKDELENLYELDAIFFQDIDRSQTIDGLDRHRHGALPGGAPVGQLVTIRR